MKFNQIKETCLYVRNLEKTIVFYRDQVGLKLFNHAEGSHAFFRAGSSVLLCFNPEATRNQDTLPPHYGSGLLHLAFESPREDYDAWLEKVKSEHIDIEHEHIWPAGHRSFYFRDPDEHCIEIIEEGMWEV